MPLASVVAFALCGATPRASDLAIEVVSGSPQTAQAYAASTEPGYVTSFSQPLVVRLSGGSGKIASLRFRCVTRGCRFALSTQPDDVKRIDPQTYEVRLRHGRATLRPVLGTEAPGTFAVDVRPAEAEVRRPSAVARFLLTAR